MSTEVRARASRRTNNRQRSPARHQRTKSLIPKLGDFGVVTIRLHNTVDHDIKTAVKDTGRRGKPTRPCPGTPPIKTHDGPSLAKDLLSRILGTDQASSRSFRTSTSDDSPVSTLQDDTTGPSDDSSISRVVSPITTTTSPDVYGSILVQLGPFLPGAYCNVEPKQTQQLPSIAWPTEQTQQHRIVANHVHSAPRQIISEDPSLTFHNELVRKHRVKLAFLAAGNRTSSAAAALSLPWDAEGNYTDGVPPHIFSPKHNWWRSIEPLYHVGKQLQLQILSAWLDEAICDDDKLRANSLVGRQPVHVFVDMSNIVIGFYNRLKAERRIGLDERIQAPPFFFEGFARCLERGRPCAKRELATSLKAGASTPGYLLEAEFSGYKTHVLQRVKGSKRSRVVAAAAMAAGMPGIYMPDSDTEAGFREQGVDELLHLKMMQSLLDTAEPGTIVLATGDAAEAEFSDGFHKNVVRALERGWHVEVIGWVDNMSAAWFDRAFRAKWPDQLRIFCLDPLVEELIAPCVT